MLTREEVDLVQADWEKILPMADGVLTRFYDRLFTLDPRFRPLFDADLKEQKLEFLKMMGVTVRGLNKLHHVVPMVQALGQRHLTHGVKPEHYDTVGDALIWALKQSIGPDFDAQHISAWANVYSLLANAMIGASEPLAFTG